MISELPLCIEERGAFLRVRVIPNAAKNRIGEVLVGPSAQRYVKVYVTAHPVDGKANLAVVKLLSEALGIPKRKITLRAGETCKNKIFTIDISPAN